MENDILKEDIQNKIGPSQNPYSLKDTRTALVESIIALGENHVPPEILNSQHCLFNLFKNLD